MNQPGRVQCAIGPHQGSEWDGAQPAKPALRGAQPALRGARLSLRSAQSPMTGTQVPPWGAQTALRDAP